jgi:hypothetical protein
LGRFHYRDISNGSDFGTSDITIRKGSEPGTFVYSNRVTGSSSQQWEAVAATHFEPISANLSFGEGDERRVSFELNYSPRHVTGVFLPKNSHEKVTVNRDVLPDTVDQRLDWAAVMSQVKLISGHNSTFHVFDPGIGESLVTVRIEGPELVHVPAGTFRAVRIIYRVEKSSGSETYQVLTNTEGPRMLLKEEFPKGSIMELTSLHD